MATSSRSGVISEFIVIAAVAAAAAAAAGVATTDFLSNLRLSVLGPADLAAAEGDGRLAKKFIIEPPKSNKANPAPVRTVSSVSLSLASANTEEPARNAGPLWRGIPVRAAWSIFGWTARAGLGRKTGGGVLQDLDLHLRGDGGWGRTLWRLS